MQQGSKRRTASLTHLLDPAVLADPYPLYRRLREESSVLWDPYLSAWVITGYADVLTVLRNYSALRVPNLHQLEEFGLDDLNAVTQVMVRQLIFMDPPQHTRLRKLIAAAFRPSTIQALRSHIQEITDRLIAEVQPSGRMDVIRDLAAPLPSIVTAELLGVPLEDREQLAAWSADFSEMLGNYSHNPGRVSVVLQSIREMTQYFRSKIIDTGSKPSEGLVASLSSADIDGDRLTENEVVANCIMIAAAGQETTTNLIGNSIYTLLRDPAQMKLLTGDMSLLPPAIEELMRYEGPSHHTARKVLDNVVLGGQQLLKGQAVIAVIAAANRDPEYFEEPDVLNILRKDNRHLAFGVGAHFCLGASLARMEAQIALESLLNRFPNLKLASNSITWRQNIGLHGLNSLPVTLQ